MHLDIHTKTNTRIVHCRCLTSSSFSPVGEIGFYHSEIKVYVTFLYFYSHKKLPSYYIKNQSCTSLQKGGNIRLKWLLFDIILFVTNERDGKLTSRDKNPTHSRFPWCKETSRQATKKNVIRPDMLDFISSRRLYEMWPMFDIILIFIRWRDAILPWRDDVLSDISISWYQYKN